ncbi:membrane protein [Longispora fulva]|uniref:Putative membrane protein n=1 Tax=Longispora fulva TaxID=619741 RepID=A0A8J7GQF5_9ACTN|nr:anthrone oxygenase family protein [Longispora fulva]MBG6135031.1 putative membrane protein [Longispora fulva]GIG56734.1 membrane protein [Longispora fulva]
MNLIRGAVLIAATVTTGLIAGLFYSFSVAVMPGLRQVEDRSFVDTMQRINVAIINGWFMLCFVGALLLTALAAVLHLRAAGRTVLPWLVAAFVLYLVMFVITSAVNVPLNNALDAAGKPGAIADLAAVRARFEATWVGWNVVRAVVSSAAFGCLTWALVLFGRSTA